MKKTFFVYLIFALVLFFLPPNVADSDGFYHFKHAVIYKENGIFYKDFPWLSASVIKELKSDIWYGFHLILIPFTYLFDQELGLKIATLFYFVICGIVLAHTLKKLSIKYPILWSLLFFLCSGRIMLRFTLLRPHILSFILVIYLFLVLFNLKDEKYSKIKIFLSTFLLSFIHLNVFWIPILIFGVFFVAKYILERQILIKEGAILLLGLIAGLLLRPNALNSIKLVIINLSTLITFKQFEIPINIGDELKPLFVDSFTTTSYPYLILLFISIFALFKYRFSFKKIIIPVILFVIFTVITLFQSARGIDYVIGFSIIIMGLVFTAINKKIINYLIFSILIFAMLFVGYRYPKVLKNNLVVQASGYDYKAGANWLINNSNDKDIVFHMNWGEFGPLFFYNSKNYYINGMDPIFEYKYNPDLFWKHLHLYTDLVPLITCGEPVCVKNNIVKTNKSLVNDFKAKFVIIPFKSYPNTYKFMKDYKLGFNEVYLDQKISIFKLILD